MDLTRARIALRERPLLDVFDLALRFCVVHRGAYARLSAAVLLPAFAVSLGAAQVGGWWLGWATAVACASFATAPFVILASRLVFADAVRTGEVLRLALRSVPALLAIRSVQLAALAASLLLVGLPWLWIGTVMLFVVEVVVLEGGPWSASFARAHRIASAHIGAVATTQFVLLMAPVGAALLADVAGRELLQTFLEIRTPPSLRQGGSWLALAGFWGLVPLSTTARFFAYLDVRTRTEGWDIQTRFAGLVAREGAGPQRSAA